VTAQSTDNPVASGIDDAGHGLGRDVMRTMCGREFTVGDLLIEKVGHPAARVSLSTRPLPQDTDTLWASLTPQEARRLAAHLLAHAAAVEDATATSAPSSRSAAPNPL